jgi:cytochrome oxidase Cu insertion factor (SCO1/SenC/PrrC family)
MPGMNSGLNLGNSTLHAAFMTALLHQGIIALLIFAVLSVAWVSIRESQPRPSAAAASPAAAAAASRLPEPSWRKLLRIGFGIIWIADGLLQAQPAMVTGLPSQVIQPGAASSPPRVQHLISWAVASWSDHPIQAAAAAVWIQVGIGVWMLAARRGTLSRLAGLAGVGWGLVVWVFGEAFGGIFAPGLSVLFGAPGAALFYCAAGALIALPERRWQLARMGRILLAGMGVFLVGMALLQAWPGRGFWQGSVHRQPGTLTGTIQAMAQTPQPRFLASWVSGFGSFVAAHGFAVNLFAVVAFALIGATLLTARPRLICPAVIAMSVLCLADWILIQDVGVFGGLGTDPNSMIPLALIVVAGYLALATAPPDESAPQPAQPERSTAQRRRGSRGPAGRRLAGLGPAGRRPAGRRPAGLSLRRLSAGRLSAARLGRAVGAADARAVVAVWAVGLTVLGAFPISAAAASRTADPIIAQALNGPPSPFNFSAPAFSLTSQSGTPVSLASLHGKVVLLTFLDPVCTTDCPLIAQEFRQADQVLGASARNVELVAIALNPVYHTPQVTRAFDLQEGLAKVPNWLYLTGSLTALRRVWHDYGIAAQVLPAGGMILHSDVAYVIDGSGHTRAELNMNPGPGTSATQSSFAVVLAGAAKHAMKPA